MMKHPVAGLRILQRAQEFSSLVAMYRKRQPKNVLEVGSFKGGTLWFWLKYAAPGAQLVSVDRVNARYWPTWKKWVPRGARLTAVSGESTDPLVIERVENLLPRGIDFLFIDGGHSYETVKADFENYGRCMRPGGIIALHDILESDVHPEVGVPRFWSELKAKYKSEELTSEPNQNGMGIGVIYL